MATEFMQQFRFDLIFELIGAGELHRAFMCCRRYCRGTAHDVQFVGILEQAHLVEQSAYIANLFRGMDTAANFFLHRIAQLEEALIPCGIAAQGIKQCGLIAH